MHIKPYFYKLGHCQDLAIEEYSFLTGDRSYIVDRGWLLGKVLVNTNLTGSLVFGGSVLGLVSQNDFSKVLELLKFELLAFREANPEIKKLGVHLPKKYLSDALVLAKKSGFKKVNLAAKVPNFGSWKHVRTWFLVISFRNQWLIGKIDTYSNQELWSLLDQNLPHRNLKPGIINLKLARSLLNLSKKLTIWDPFCGQGGLLVAGLDLKQNFLASDILSSCLLQTQENFIEAKSIWQKNWKHLNFNHDFSPANLVTEILDARHLSLSKHFGFFKELAIVTEGYLGDNFTRPPKLLDAHLEFQKIRDLWSQVILQASKLRVTELIFCLPVYLQIQTTNSKPLWPKFQNELIKNTCYRFYQFTNQKSGILYNRSNSYVGHLIVKLISDQCLN